MTQVLSTCYVLQDRGTKMFKKNSLEWTDDIERAWKLNNRDVAFREANGIYDVMIYRTTLEKDNL